MATIEKRITKDGTVKYRAKVRIKGYPLVTETFDRKTDARDWAAEMESDIKFRNHFPNNHAKKRTVGELIDAYMQHLSGHNARRHKEVKTIMGWWKAELGERLLMHIRVPDIIACKDKLIARKKRGSSPDVVETISPATVNRYLTAFSTAINYGVKQMKWVHENPVVDVQKLKEPAGRVRFLSEQEKQALLLACRNSKNTMLYPIVVLGIATGGRRREIERLKWADLTPDWRRAQLQHTKNGSVRSLFLPPIAVELLRQIHAMKSTDSDYIFPSPNNPQRPYNFERTWQNALAQAKIIDFHFHDLRHTCASYLAMNGASTLVIAEVLGHKTLSMVKRYAHLSPTHTTDVLSQMTQKELGHG